MADAMTVSILSCVVHRRPTLGSPHSPCPCQSTLQHAPSRPVAIDSYPILSHRHRPGVRRGLASRHLVYATSSRPSSRPEGSETDSPPSSREEVVQQAGAALKKQGPSTVKQRKLQRQVRLRVDIPVLEESPQALVTLTRDLLESFLDGGKKVSGKVAVYFTDSALVDAALSSPSASYHSLEDSEILPQSSVVALVIAPRFQQASALESVVRNAGVRPVIVVNPDWSEEAEGDKTWGPFLASFCVAYSFMPLNIQGFFSRTEGAVLKRVRSGAPEGQPWLVFVKEGDKYKCVSRLKKRPTPTDLENALYSSMAANSPVNKSIAFFRGLVSKRHSVHRILGVKLHSRLPAYESIEFVE